MATTNLNTRTIGNIYLQSGNGSPDHTAPIGSIYTDETANRIYFNANGGTIWVSALKVAYGSAYFNNNTTAITGVTLNTWEDLQAYTFTELYSSGTTVGTNGIVTCNNTPGRYKITAICTFNYNGVQTSSYQVGISKNGGNPTGFLGAATVSSTIITKCAMSTDIISLVSGDTIEVMVEYIAGNHNILPKHVSLYMERIGD